MIKVRKFDNLHIQVITNDRAYVADFKAYFTDYVEGYRFQPKFKQGGWSGQVCLVSSGNILPFGLLFDFIMFHKKHYKDMELQIDEDVKDFFTGVDIDPEYDLTIFPRPYQEESIEACLKYKSGIIVAATASGKSCIITYIIKALMDNNYIKKTLIIVPTINLVTQFHSDMIEYGIPETQIGRVYAKIKQFDKDIVISTWQTLSKNYDKLKSFDCVIADECLNGDTLIKTPNGLVPIKNIQIGDNVISYNIEQKKFETDIVCNVFNNLSSTEKMYELEFDNGSKLQITGNHKILTKRGYVRADCLTEDDNVISLFL